MSVEMLLLAALCVFLAHWSTFQVHGSAVGARLNASTIPDYFFIKIRFKPCTNDTTESNVTVVIVRADENQIPIHWTSEIPIQRVDEGRVTFGKNKSKGLHGYTVFPIRNVCKSALLNVCDKITHLVFRLDSTTQLRYDSIKVISPHGKTFEFTNGENCWCDSYMINPCNGQRRRLFVAGRAGLIGGVNSAGYGDESLNSMLKRMHVEDNSLESRLYGYKFCDDEGKYYCKKRDLES